MLADPPQTIRDRRLDSPPGGNDRSNEADDERRGDVQVDRLGGHIESGEILFQGLAKGLGCGKAEKNAAEGSRSALLPATHRI